MTDALAPDALDEGRIRAAVSVFARSRFLVPNELGARMSIESIDARWSYAIRVRSEVEERRFVEDDEPYRGQSIDDRGDPPGLWEPRCEAPEGFTDRTKRIRREHTDRVQRCGDCGGDGRVRCSTCHGRGEVDCTWCGGDGWRTRTEWRDEPDGQGGTRRRSESVREPCRHCRSGRVDCGRCHGRGRVDCRRCDAQGELVRFQTLVVKFRDRVLDRVEDRTALPDELVKGARGETLFDENANRIGADEVAHVSAEVDAIVAELLGKSHGWDQDDDARLLFQQARVRRVGVHEVRYRWRSGPPKRLWVYGDRRKVHAPGAPVAWSLILTVLGVVAGAVALGLAIVFGGTLLAAGPSGSRAGAPVASGEPVLEAADADLRGEVLDAAREAVRSRVGSFSHLTAAFHAWHLDVEPGVRHLQLGYEGGLVGWIKVRVVEPVGGGGWSATIEERGDRLWALHPEVAPGLPEVEVAAWRALAAHLAETAPGEPVVDLAAVARGWAGDGVRVVELRYRLGTDDPSAVRSVSAGAMAPGRRSRSRRTTSGTADDADDTD